MGNQYTEDENEELEGNDLIKDLRRQVKGLSKDKNDLSNELNTMKGTVRERSVAEVLSAKGVNTKVAKLIPSDVEGEEAITKWLEEFDFTITSNNDNSQSTKPNVSEDQINESKRLQTISNSGQSPSKLNDLAERMAVASSSELDALLKEAKQYLM